MTEKIWIKGMDYAFRVETAMNQTTRTPLFTQETYLRFSGVGYIQVFLKNTYPSMHKICNCDTFLQIQLIK